MCAKILDHVSHVGPKCPNHQIEPLCAFSNLIYCYQLQEMTSAEVEGNGAITGHIISTTIGGKNGEPKQVRLVTSSCFCDF